MATIKPAKERPARARASGGVRHFHSHIHGAHIHPGVLDADVEAKPQRAKAASSSSSVVIVVASKIIQHCLNVRGVALAEVTRPISNCFLRARGRIPLYSCCGGFSLMLP